MRFSSFLFVLVFSCGYIPSGWAKIYIDITQVSTNSFPMALVPPYQVGGMEDKSKLSSQLMSVVQKDLELIGIFRFIERSAFLENPEKKTFASTDIDFSSWALLDTLALVKGWYRLDAQKVTFELHLFDVLSKSELFVKQYEGTPQDVSEMAHRFANEIMQALTGEEGVFQTKIAFIGKPRLSAEKELCVMDFDGSNVKTLTSHRSVTLSPAWAGDGRSILYTSFGPAKTPQIFRYDLDKHSTQRITSFPGMAVGLSLHPASHLIATSLTRDGNWEIYLLTLDGAIKNRLTINNDIDVSARFSPDGKDLVFVSNRDGRPQVYKINISGKVAQRLTFKGNNNTSPVWSPKGDKIAFAGMDTDGHFDIFSMNTDGSGMVRLTYDTRNNEEPSWAPGGQLITFSSNRTGRYQIWSMRPDGSKQMQLTRELWDHHMPVWGSRPK